MFKKVLLLISIFIFNKSLISSEVEPNQKNFSEKEMQLILLDSYNFDKIDEKQNYANMIIGFINQRLKYAPKEQHILILENIIKSLNNLIAKAPKDKAVNILNDIIDKIIKRICKKKYKAIATALQNQHCDIFSKTNDLSCANVAYLESLQKYINELEQQNKYTNDADKKVIITHLIKILKANYEAFPSSNKLLNPNQY